MEALDPLLHPEAYGGLIFTSSRTVEGIHRRDAALDDAGHHWTAAALPFWRRKPVFVVGVTTGAAAAAEFGCTVQGQTTGSAALLADAVVALEGAGKAALQPLLFVCGKERGDTLPDRLACAGVAVQEMHVYAGSVSEQAAQAVVDWVCANDAAAVVFFSPRGPAPCNCLSPLRGVRGHRTNDGGERRGCHRHSPRQRGHRAATLRGG